MGPVIVVLHTFAREGVDDLLLDTLLTLGETLVLQAKLVSIRSTTSTTTSSTLPTAMMGGNER